MWGVWELIRDPEMALTRVCDMIHRPVTECLLPPHWQKWREWIFHQKLEVKEVIHPLPCDHDGNQKIQEEDCHWDEKDYHEHTPVYHLHLWEGESPQIFPKWHRSSNMRMGSSEPRPDWFDPWVVFWGFPTTLNWKITHQMSAQGISGCVRLKIIKVESTQRGLEHGQHWPSVVTVTRDGFCIHS